MPLKNPKAKGSRSERKVRDYLRAQGYHVIKAGGSLGEWDLVALPTWLQVVDKGFSPIVIQVKSNRPPSNKEVERLNKSNVWGMRRIAIVHDRKGIEWIDL